ncbi:MAG: AbrB/MazE/SpoVT family DNA-binding domain-containing protein [Eubacteriales bacterium]|jgi:antitoxin MazE|nr:AbrB/MazE/SpoVT family DNA-binding domain-containing protein [Eubacteriales bacterium]
MIIRLAKWDNSVAIRIPKKILRELNIGSGDIYNIAFNAAVEGNRLILTKKQNRDD